ncbi:DNA repair protein rhp57 [Cyphellophora attinorum]|uniref:DNA repair protein rhp57 n=1 Tax=Cyphellophora attinorum TaxID=1664694 RepID=A0A0N0NIG5_9EURO|nr:DNA repair protein rhp57 [Phialophora attinorum]KPI35718.1 DNA repair protein rhp57 [Phialophora attinorum]
MTDLFEVLPGFDITNYRHLMHSLTRENITVAELVSLEPAEIARRCPLPLLDVQRLVANVIGRLHSDLNMITKPQSSSDLLPTASDAKSKSLSSSAAKFISTLDPDIDAALGGGFPTGFVSEVVGESAAGKTQILYGLLLSAQLPEPQGLGKAVVYISTEDELYTKRLVQILTSSPVYQGLPAHQKPSLDNVYTIKATNFDRLMHILEFQIPHFLRKSKFGLLVLDSAAAALHGGDRMGDAAVALGARASELGRLGQALHNIAMEKNIAVVCSNQVRDRFTESIIPTQDIMRSSPSETPSTQSTSAQRDARNTIMSLDHQQRFFTGWGDKPVDQLHDLKTPALGPAWASQVDARIVLKFGDGPSSSKDDEAIRRRFINVVYAPWTGPKVRSTEFTIEAGGLVARKQDKKQQEIEELLDDSLWKDDEEDQEFP